MQRPTKTRTRIKRARLGVLFQEMKRELWRRFGCGTCCGKHVHPYVTTQVWN